jgi:hypothetical protein
MKLPLLIAGVAWLAPFGVISAHAEVKAVVVSRGPRVELKKVLREEGTTALLFMQDTSAMEQQFLASLEKQLVADPKLALAVVRLKDTAAPAAQQFSVAATPTVIVFDRFGREIGRTSQPDEIAAAVRKGHLMGRIKWVDEDDPKAPEVYGAPAESIKRGLPGIIKTMSLRPEAVQMMNLISRIHFSDGFLKRREHEMVAAYVSALNKCRF